MMMRKKEGREGYINIIIVGQDWLVYFYLLLVYLHYFTYFILLIKLIKPQVRVEAEVIWA